MEKMFMNMCTGMVDTMENWKARFDATPEDMRECDFGSEVFEEAELNPARQIVIPAPCWAPGGEYVEYESVEAFMEEFLEGAEGSEESIPEDGFKDGRDYTVEWTADGCLNWLNHGILFRD